MNERMGLGVYIAVYAIATPIILIYFKEFFNEELASDRNQEKLELHSKRYSFW